MPFKSRLRQTDYNREWMRKRRQEVITQLGGKCTMCGVTDELEIDYIDPSAKALPIGSVLGMSLSNPVRIAELAKCQLLCSKHHSEKTVQARTEQRNKTIAQVYHLRDTTDLNQRQIAERIGIHRSHVTHILSKR